MNSRQGEHTGISWCQLQSFASLADHRMPIGIAECGTQYASRMTTSAIKIQTETLARCGDGTSITYDPTRGASQIG
jgi:hypothetical protein